MAKSKKPDNRTLYEKQHPRWDESRYDYIDIVVSSGEIRKLFFQRCKDLKLDPYRVGMAAGIAPRRLKQDYVNTQNPRCSKYFEQDKFLKMIELVGIDIKVLVKVKPFAETYVRLREKGIIKE